MTNTDKACGQCITDNLSWPVARGGCGSWECTCSGGFPEFALMHRSPCADACASTLQRRAQERLDTPTPPAIGHSPSVLSELTQFSAISKLSVTAGGFWAATFADQTVQATRFDSKLEVQWSQGLGGDLQFIADMESAASGDGIYLASDRSGAIQTLLRYTPLGDQSASPLTSPGYNDTFVALAQTVSGTFVLGSSGFVIAQLDADGGTPTTQTGTPSTGAPNTLKLGDIAIDSQGHMAVVGTDQDRGALARYDLTENLSTPIYERFFTAHSFAGETGTVTCVVIDALGFTFVGGSLYGEKKTARGSITTSEPFVARVSPAGEVVWQWKYDDNAIVSGQVNALAADGQGNVYAVGTEDPEPEATGEKSDKCTVYGCDGLVVRKFAPSGEIVWEYQHRSASSAGLAIAIDGSGSVVVAGKLVREQHMGLLMRFPAN